MNESHAVAVVLPAGHDIERIEREVGVLWRETVPARRVDELAVRRRDRELRRPLGGEPGLRAVLLSYTDAHELILVAHRDRLDRAGLTALACALRAGESIVDTSRVGPLVDAALVAEARNALRPLSFCWGLAGSGRSGGTVPPVVLAASGEADESQVVAAVALTLARYERVPDLVLGVLGGGGDVSLVPVAVSEEATISGYVLEVGASVRRFAACAHRDLAGVKTVGLLFGSEDVEYHSAALAEFPLRLDVRRDPLRPNNFLARVDFDPALFDPSVIARFGEALARAFRGLVDAEDGSPVHTLSWLDAGESARLAALGDGGPLPPAAHRTIHEAVADCAARQPDAVAVCFGEIRLTYRELVERADRVAAALHRNGVRPGDRVGVCLPKSAELVVILLGVLRAGAAYVPMDPAYPVERLRYTSEDAGLAVVVADRGFPAPAVLEPGELSAGEPVAATEVSSDDAAYVIYTSGSTGRPKGVVVPHRNVVSLLAATAADFGFRATDTWTFFHSAAFDFSVWEIWGCLMTGGRLVVVAPLVARSAPEFHALLTAERVTVLNQTPTAFGQLAGIADPAGLALRLVIFGGEPLDTGPLGPWFDRLPEWSCRMVNMFGITETTVHVTAQTLTRHATVVSSRSVGGAIPGWSVSVHDSRGRIVPCGVLGEIWVGGAGLADYLNRPELSAERFVTDPHTGQRRYRSGDLGRLLPDGTLEHWGRIDRQVSVRGHRVELDEITSVLLEDHHVQAAAVIVGSGDEQDRLFGFVVAAPGTDPTRLRRRAATVLPDYMVPATITCLPELPLTVNGKLDTARLEALRLTAGSNVDQPPPESGTLGIVCSVWSALLKVDTPPDADFFDLGGNSLLAARMSALLQERGLPPLPVRQLYRTPTPTGVTAYYDNIEGAQPAAA